MILFLLGCGWRAPLDGEVPESPAEAVAAPVEAAPVAAVPAPSIDVVLLGTGTPVPDVRRSGPSTAVLVDGRALLFDTGPGVIRQAQAAAEKHRLPGLLPENLRHVFLTHLHSDHTTGLPDLLLGGWVLGRTTSVRVVGPPGTKALVDSILAGWRPDIDIRQGKGEDLPPSGIQVDVVEIDGGEAYTADGLSVRALQVPHGTWDVALGFVVDVGERRVVISGDTGPSEALMDACGGCDLLVHEVYSQWGFDQVPSASFQAYHSSFHTSGVELGPLATRAKPDQLVLTHLLFFGANEERLKAEVTQGFAGPVAVGADLERYRVAP